MRNIELQMLRPLRRLTRRYASDEVVDRMDSRRKGQRLSIRRGHGKARFNRSLLEEFAYKKLYTPDDERRAELGP